MPDPEGDYVQLIFNFTRFTLFKQQKSVLVKGSIEDIIYIVIGIVWIAYSIYKGTQKSREKQKRPDTTSKPSQDRKSVFESFINDIITEEDESPYVQSAEEIQEPEVEKLADSKPPERKKVFSYDDYFEESNYRREKSVYGDSRVVNEVDTEKKIVLK